MLALEVFEASMRITASSTISFEEIIQDNYEKHVEIKELNSFKDLQSLYEFVIS